jgi:hypothetical protein
MVTLQNGASTETLSRTTKVRHTESARDQFTEARRVLKIGFAYQAELAQVGDRLANTTITDNEFHAFLNSLLPTLDPSSGSPNRQISRVPTP